MRRKQFLVRHFQAKGVEIKREGGIEAVEIDKCMLVDRHYCSIASKAALKKPTEMNVPMDKFKEFSTLIGTRPSRLARFPVPRMRVKTSNRRRRNVRDVGKAKKVKTLIKFGGGFYCASLPCDESRGASKSCLGHEWCDRDAASRSTESTLS